MPYTQHTAWREAVQELYELADRNFTSAREGSDASNSWGRTRTTLEQLINGEIELSHNDARRTFQRYDTARIAARVFERWDARLVAHGRALDEGIDRLLTLIGNESFDVRSSISRLNERLNELLAMRADLQAFESEIEEFMEKHTDIRLGALDLSAQIHILNQVNRTYDRAYDLSIMKINTIASRRTTYSSLALALAAVAISVISILS